MYQPGTYQCVSFSSSKILGIEQGGAILHDDLHADAWFRKARFDGRTEGESQLEDNFILGYHLIMLPSIAAQTLLKLYHLPKHNEDLPEIEYPDLSLQEMK
jgi:dTDP-4-amino-4,6-dideoxygalactose transaminase